MGPNFFNKSLFLIIPLVGIVIVGVFLISYGVTDPGTSLAMALHGIIMTAGLWLGCMVIVIFLWKRFPWEQSPLLHLTIEIVLILIYTIGFSSLLYLLEQSFWKIPKATNLGIEIFVTILITFFILSIHESIFFYQQWKYNFSKSARLEKDNIEAKYEALKAQINPHFLFNSLNSLTTMVQGNKAVEDYIENLSGLLRYMMKSGENELVRLIDELEIVNSYVSLQKTRFSESLRFNVSIPDDHNNYLLPPLVIINLIENCIKHNIISLEKPLVIDIFSANESLTVTNNLQRKQGVISTGQGLNNIKGRYGFFTTRKIEISETSSQFRVEIPLLKADK
jgi:sensor histidine kinase YesM